jgi:two-component system response regulator AdeR
MSSALVLIAEDEPEISQIIVTYLERAGFRTATAQDGDVAIAVFHQLKPDILLLDIKMPKRDGVDVLRDVRRTSQTPVIMITAMAEDIEKVSALRLGADDYITKPFNPLEVVERVKAVLRRSDGATDTTKSLRIGPLYVDISAHAIFAEDAAGIQLVPLTLTEYSLIAHMARAPQRAFSRSELVDACLSEGEALERTVDSHVSNARRKIEKLGVAGYLQTVRGVGYRLAPLI